MNTDTINELNTRLHYHAWKRRNKQEQGVINTTRTHSCDQCAKWAERKQKLGAWTLRCVGVALTGAFHVSLAVGVVMALNAGVIF